jgi:hypothetical protein
MPPSLMVILLSFHLLSLVPAERSVQQRNQHALQLKLKHPNYHSVLAGSVHY